MTGRRHVQGLDVADKSVSFSISFPKTSFAQHKPAPNVDRLDLNCVLGESCDIRRAKITDDSGHLSEGSYDLAWDRDKGWSRRRMTNLTASDHSVPLDDLNTPIRDDISDRYVFLERTRDLERKPMFGHFDGSLIPHLFHFCLASLFEEIAGIDDFAHTSFEYDELNISNEFLHVPDSPYQALKHVVSHNGIGDDDVSLKHQSHLRKAPFDITTKREALDTRSKSCCDGIIPKKSSNTDAKILFLGEIIRSMGMIEQHDDDNRESSVSTNSEHMGD